MGSSLQFFVSLVCLLALSLFLNRRIATDGSSATDQSHLTNHHDSPKNIITTTTNPNNTSSVFPLNLSDSAFSLDQYKTLLEEPYRSYPCQPKRIHISQLNNVHEIPFPPDETNFHNQSTLAVVSMTISFMLDHDNCADAKPKITCRQGFHRNFRPAKDKKKQQEATVGTTAHEMLRLGRRRAAAAESKIVVGATPEYSFVTPPLPHTPTAIALVGDLGQTVNSTKTMAHIFHDSRSENNNNKNPTTLLLIAGDMPYADSDPQRWHSWFDLMEPLTRSLTMHVAAGNHEIECDNVTLEIFKPYEHFFKNPNRIFEAQLEPITKEYRQSLPDQYCSTPSEFQGAYNYGNAFYSFHHGLVHFIVLSSYSDSRKGSRQYDWLVEELTLNVNRTLTPWVLVSFHSPLYTTFTGHVNEQQSIQMKQAMEPVFQEGGVNLVICGHDHGYMRSHSLLVNGTVDPTGTSPVYLTLGAAGNREQHSRGYRNETTPEDFVAMRDLRDFGYGNLLVTNATHAILNWVRDGVTKEGIDDKNVWIVNHYAPQTKSESTDLNNHEPRHHWDVNQDGHAQYATAA
ncbi:Zn(2+) purple acid phosphatase [Seminavis robusta]|uniref:Zn(2+) purple acid phosphatase n=1 Tax=Seminavis robusta TaxID=568900 RepID=A0A9N8EDP4_9STRA|nr:Zn(2+) purple acid phosphatase [Seminavis robusta]|eukprot:Sro851_g210900.1 Zn(2+) purple acid phosphatase (570) ;mRNA; r:31412-33446